VHVQQGKGLTSTWTVFCLHCRAIVSCLLNQRAKTSGRNLEAGGVQLPICNGWPVCSWTWRPFRNREGQHLVGLRKFLFTLHILILHLRIKFAMDYLENENCHTGIVSCLLIQTSATSGGNEVCIIQRYDMMTCSFIVLLVSPLGIPYGEAALQLPNRSLFYNLPLKMPT